MNIQNKTYARNAATMAKKEDDMRKLSTKWREKSKQNVCKNKLWKWKTNKDRHRQSKYMYRERMRGNLIEG